MQYNKKVYQKDNSDITLNIVLGLLYWNVTKGKDFKAYIVFKFNLENCVCILIKFESGGTH